MENTTKINVAKQFSKYPGGRFTTDGDFSGQRFREQLLGPALKNFSSVVVEVDGTLGYGSSFLEEAFGGLIRESGFDANDVQKRLTIISANETLRYTIESYISDAKAKELV